MMHVNSRARQALRALVLLASVSSAAQAIGAVQRDPPAATPIQDPSGAAEIVVTAQHRSERLVDVPVSVAVASGVQLKDAGVTNLKDIQLVAPGVIMSAITAYAQPIIRGIGSNTTSAGEDPPTSTYVDGLYQPNKIGGMMDLPDINRIEVLKGPQGTLYGRNSLGGAIVIHTLDPSLSDLKLHSDLSVGTYAGGGSRSGPVVRASGYTSIPLVDNKLALGIAGFYEYSGGYNTDVVTGKRTGTVKDYLVRAKLLYEATDKRCFILTGSISRMNDGSEDYHPYKGMTVSAGFPDALIPTKPYHVAFELGDEAARFKSLAKTIALHADLDVGDLGKLSSDAGYTHVNSGAIVDLDASYSPSCLAAFTCAQVDAYANNDRVAQENLSFASNRFSIFELTLGANYYHDVARYADRLFPATVPDGLHFKVDTSQPPLVSGTDGTIRTTAWAGFGELTAHITDKLHIVGGIRYGTESKVSRGSVNIFDTAVLGPPSPFVSFGPVAEHSWTPRASIRYNVTNHANVYFTYSQGYKSGVLNGTNFNGNSAQPEKLYSYEVGAKIASSGFSLNVAGFYYDRRDIQKVLVLGNVNVFSNAASATVFGLDADASIRLTQGLTLRAGGSWLPKADYKNFANAQELVPQVSGTGAVTFSLEAINMSHKRLERAPKLTGNIGLDYSTNIAWGKLNASTNLSYTSTYNWDYLGRVKTNGYAELSLRASLQPTGSRFRFGVYGTNLTDNRHISSTLMDALVDGVIYGAPREIGITAGFDL